MGRELVGAVFKDEVEAGQAVRALHYWNRKRHQGLGVMCVVVRKRVGGARYRPYRVVRARGGARWGLLAGALVVGLLAAGAAGATSSFLGTASSWIKLATSAVTGWIGTGNAIDVGPMLRQAAGYPYGAPVVAGLAGAVVGGIAGAVVFGLLGAIAHVFKGFRRSIRREVADELEPGTAAVLAWARGATAIVTRGELERLGGNAAPDQPTGPAADASSTAPPAGAARSWAPPGS
jgi:uncharacterized membrane protein